MHRSKLAIVRVLIQHITGPKNAGFYALYWHAVIVEWVGHCLATPIIVRAPRTEIVNLYDDGVPERASERGRVRVRRRGDLEAASTGAPSTGVGTECKLIYRSGVPIHSLAAS